MRRCRPLLGTFVEIDCDFAPAIDEGFAAVERVHGLMSAHEVDSDISRINRFAHIEPVAVHDWTARVIGRALYWSKLSEGAFDVVRAGKRAVERSALPLHEDQPSPIAERWEELDIEGALVRLPRPGCLDLGGIAKGFAVDRAVDALCKAGCTAGLVNAGGDLRAFGPQAQSISIVEPARRAPIAACEIRDRAMATSAALSEGEGFSFDHLLDARSEWTSVTVIGADACDSDALTKIVWKSGHGSNALLARVDAQGFAIRSSGSIEHLGAERLAA
jgi:thiamine biosynthesis lipoprotein